MNEWMKTATYQTLLWNPFHRDQKIREVADLADTGWRQQEKKLLERPEAERKSTKPITAVTAGDLNVNKNGPETPNWASLTGPGFIAQTYTMYACGCSVAGDQTEC